jgi:hypothetical protein
VVTAGRDTVLSKDGNRAGVEDRDRHGQGSNDQRVKAEASGVDGSPECSTPGDRGMLVGLGASRNAHASVVVTALRLRLRGGRVLKRRVLVTRPQRLAAKSLVRGSPARSESTARRLVTEQEQQQVVGER